MDSWKFRSNSSREAARRASKSVFSAARRSQTPPYLQRDEHKNLRFGPVDKREDFPSVFSGARQENPFVRQPNLFVRLRYVLVPFKRDEGILQPSHSFLLVHQDGVLRLLVNDELHGELHLSKLIGNSFREVIFMLRLSCLLILIPMISGRHS